MKWNHHKFCSCSVRYLTSACHCHCYQVGFDCQFMVFGSICGPFAAQLRFKHHQFSVKWAKCIRWKPLRLICVKIASWPTLGILWCFLYQTWQMDVRTSLSLMATHFHSYFIWKPHWVMWKISSDTFYLSRKKKIILMQLIFELLLFLFFAACQFSSKCDASLVSVINFVLSSGAHEEFISIINIFRAFQHYFFFILASLSFCTLDFNLVLILMCTMKFAFFHWLSTMQQTLTEPAH